MSPLARMDTPLAFSPLPAQRLQQLQHLFEQIARSRMAGLPILNPALRVEALGFEPLPAEALPADPAAQAPPQPRPELLGILITPWFMNLLCLPLRPCLAPAAEPKRTLHLGGQRFEFLPHVEPALGAFWCCSLFSPMNEFAAQAQARETALAVLQALRAKPAAAPQAEAVHASRRALLFGRPAAISAAGRL